MDDLPLKDITVLDLSHFVAGPWCTMILADLGAEVIKVEPPGTGEIGRNMGGVYAGDESAIFLGFNRNKRSIAVDLKHPEGLEIVHKLVARADALVENFRPGTADRLGVGRERVTAINPSLVYCSVSAFGSDGPYAELPANDPIVQAISGAMVETGDPDGEPLRMGVSVPDFAAGVLATLAVISSLYQRSKQGRGEHANLSLLGAQLFAQLDRVQAELAKRSRQRCYIDWFDVLGRRALRCADDYHLVIGVNDDNTFQRLVETLDCKQLLSEPTRSAPALIVSTVASRIETASLDYWLRALKEVGVPVAPVRDLSEVFATERLGDSLVEQMVHPLVGNLRFVRTPLTNAGTWDYDRRPPPLLGQHSAEILTQLGYTSGEQAALVDKRVVEQGAR